MTRQTSKQIKWNTILIWIGGITIAWWFYVQFIRLLYWIFS